MRVEKPARYTGGELHTVKKELSRNKNQIWFRLSGHL